MKLSFNKAKLIRSGLWASNCATYSTGLDFKVCLRARTVSAPFEKRALGVNLIKLVQVLFTSTCSCSFQTLKQRLHL